MVNKYQLTLITHSNYCFTNVNLCKGMTQKLKCSLRVHVSNFTFVSEHVHFPAVTAMYTL